MDPYKARKIAKVIAIVVALAMIITSFSFVFMIPSMFGMEGSVVYAAASDDDLDQEMENLKQYIEYIRQNYKDDVTYDQLVNGAFEGAVDSLGDPYSVYYKTEEEANSFMESVSGEFSGVGLNIENFNGQCRVVAPIPGTPAEKSGVKSGDIITKIDGIDITSKTLEEAVSMMRGEAGTRVTLTIDRMGQALTFNLIREKIKNVSVNYKMLDGRIGYIQLTSFDNDSNVEFRLAKTALINKGATALILDIRNNPGGLVNTALDIANQLMAKGPIMHYAHKDEIVKTYSADGNSKLDIPMVLLVNEGSASASEILAGALQDSKTAVLVGSTTFGKGIAQEVGTFSEGYGLKLSTFYFLTPNKNKINQIGITPDYTVQGIANGNEKELIEKYMSFAPMSEKVKPKAGDIGINVFGAQQRLSMIGYIVKATGTMDDTTVTAVKKFQKENALWPSGILDYSTMSALDKAVANYITGTKADEDLQLDKAIELIK